MSHLEDAGTGSQKPTGLLMGAASACGASRREGARLAPLLGALAGLALWGGSGPPGAGLPSFFPPPPSFILQTLWHMAVTGKLLPALAQTLFRLGAGLALGGGTVGLMTGWAMGLSRTVRTVLNPVVAALHPVIIATLGTLTNRLIELATHRFTPWQNREHHHG